MEVSDTDLTDNDQVTISASLPNVGPNADAGEDQNVEVDELVTLDGSGSDDPDSGPGPLTYLWTFLSVPPESTLTDGDITNPTSVDPTFTPDAEGTFEVNLEVSDSDLTDDDQVNIIAAFPNVAPNADAGDDREVELGPVVGV